MTHLAPAVVGWALPFTLVLTLGLSNGGYDITTRSEIGIAIWWVVLIGAASGMINFRRIGSAAWVIIAIMAAFALWTGLGSTWSESVERSFVEFGRVLTYLGLLVIAVATQRGEALRRTIASTGAAIALIALIALLSRLHPEWFSSAVARARLNYPLNYWNGLAALMAVGLPLMLTMALQARSLLGQALAVAAAPIMGLTAFYTLSRGGAIEIGVGVGVFVALYPRRLAAAPTLLLATAGTALLVVAALQRDDLEKGLLSASADSQRHEMLAMVAVVCVGVAAVQLAIGLARRYGLGPKPEVSRRTTWVLTLLALGVVSIGAIGAGVPGELNSRWNDFKEPSAATGTTVTRFESSSGSGRYQTWQSAIDAYQSSKVTGIGPGTFELWWAREGTIPVFVRDAHSLYLETLGELGVVGFVLVLGLIGGVLALGVRRCLRASEDKRALLAGAIAGCAAFSAAAMIDWVWELAVIPCTFILLAAAIAGPKVVRTRFANAPRTRKRVRSSLRDRRRTAALRLGIAGASVGAIVAIAIPYAGASALSDSHDAAQSSNLPAALAAANTAADIQPYAASPYLQRAMLLALNGDLRGSAAAASEATDKEPTNWRNWLVLSRIEAFRGNAEASVDAYLEARSLNPRSPLFTNVEQ